jgi:hypothetical protein
MKYFAVQTTLSDGKIKDALKNQCAGTFRAKEAWQRATKVKRQLTGEPLVLLICRPQSKVGVEWVALIDEVSYRSSSSDVAFSRLGVLKSAIPLSSFTKPRGGKPLSDRYPSAYTVCLYEESWSTVLMSSLGSSRKSSETTSPVVTAAHFMRRAAEEELNNDPKTRTLNSTAKALLVEARIGQGTYRADLMKLWDGKCSLTGCDIPQVLIASHAKPWAESSNKERLDAFNGLLLSAHIDRLFDTGLISFCDKGRLLVSEEVNADSLASIGLSRTASLRFVRKEHLQYLAAHRARSGF